MNVLARIAGWAMVGTVLFVLALGMAHFCMPDPQAQIERGIEQARAACAQHLDRTPQQHRVCRLVAQ